MPRQEGDNDAYSVEESERQHEEHLRYQVRWRQNRRENGNANDTVTNMPDKETVIDQTDAGKEVRDHRKLEHYPKRQDEPGHKREIFPHLYQGMHLNGFISPQQKLESELQKDLIAKSRPREKKK